ncbi:MAG: hypothetical protein AAGB31_03725 [Bdellovibrio sp.]
MKKVAYICLMFLMSLKVFASPSNEMVLRFDNNTSNAENIAEFIKTHQEKSQPHQIIFEFYDSNTAFLFPIQASDSKSIREEIYRKSYPNGDFYYLIGDLSDGWTKSDYEKFYSVAKWLSLRGFRTIFNVAAFAIDLQEALANKNTSALIWNSHGATDGTIFDTNKVAIATDTFVKLRTGNLKYILFANCDGYNSINKYGLRKMNKMRAMGWKYSITSNHLFEYIFSKKFDIDLSKALEKKIIKKPTRKIAL